MTYMRLICGFFIIVCVAFIAAPAFTAEHKDYRPLCLEQPQAFDYKVFTMAAIVTAKKQGMEVKAPAINPIHPLIREWMQEVEMFKDLPRMEWNLYQAILTPKGAFAYRGQTYPNRKDGLEPICFVFILNDEQSKIIFGITPAELNGKGT